MDRAHRVAVMVFSLCLALQTHAQMTGAELIAELQSGDSNRCMNASNATSEYQDHYQEIASELAAPLMAIVQSGEGCSDSAISALLNLGPGIADGVDAKNAVPALVGVVEHGFDPGNYEAASTAGTAVMVIGYFGSKAGMGVPVLQRWVTQGPDFHSRSYALDTLAQIGDAAAPAVPAMLALLEPPAEDDEHAWEKNELRASVVRALGSIPAAAGSSAPALVALLGSDDYSLRYLAGESLTSMGAPAVSHLVSSMSNSDPERRAQVLEILGAMGAGAAEAVPSIVPLLADEDWNVKSAAGMALSEIGPTEAGVAALVKVLEGRDDDAASAAAGVLRDYGSAASAALPALRKAAAGDNWQVSDAAKEAVLAVGGGN